MKAFENLAEARKEFRKIKSGCAGDTIFMAHMSLMVCEQMEKLYKLKVREAEEQLKRMQRKTHIARKLTEYQKFFARQIKAGKTAAETAKLWHERIS